MTSPPARRFAAAFALFMLLAGLMTGIVVAHAELDTATPADKSTVQGSPAEIVMTFTEPLKPANSSIKLVDASGVVIVQGSTVDASDPKTMRLDLPTVLAPATYTVRWTTASALDGDLDHGTTTFTVTAAPATSPSAVASRPVPSASIAPSTGAVSAAPSPAPSTPPTTQTTSTTDAVIPIVVVLVALAALALWFIRGRSRGIR
jgi:methionine-rich copper-binding protein CopC